jgi:hypothetical protein
MMSPTVTPEPQARDEAIATDITVIADWIASTIRAIAIMTCAQPVLDSFDNLSSNQGYCYYDLNPFLHIQFACVYWRYDSLEKRSD